VMGNISLVQATHNAGVVLDVADAPPIPIYQGCARPLLQTEPADASNFHGEDGLGGAGKPTTTRPVEAEHASLALIRLVQENPGQLTLLTLGPLTNLALAIRLYPNLPRQLKRLVIMGGAVDARGNTSAAAEFNIGVDPEAAKIVFKACQDVPEGIWLLPWETSLCHAIPMAEWEAIIAGDRPPAQFVRQMTPHLKQVMTRFNFAGTIWPDPLAAAVALSPEIITQQEERLVEVERGSGLARGQTIVDYRFNGHSSSNLHIVRHVDDQKFKALLRLAL